MSRWITLLAGIAAGFAALLGFYSWFALDDRKVAAVAFAVMAMLAIVPSLGRNRRKNCGT